MTIKKRASKRKPEQEGIIIISDDEAVEPKIGAPSCSGIFNTVIHCQKGCVVARNYESGDLFGRFKDALSHLEVERSLFSLSDEDDLEETRESLQKEWEIISEIEKVEEELARVNKQMKYEQRTRKKRIYKRIKVS